MPPRISSPWWTRSPRPSLALFRRRRWSTRPSWRTCYASTRALPTVLLMIYIYIYVYVYPASCNAYHLCYIPIISIFFSASSLLLDHAGCISSTVAVTFCSFLVVKLYTIGRNCREATGRLALALPEGSWTSWIP